MEVKNPGKDPGKIPIDLPSGDVRNRFACDYEDKENFDESANDLSEDSADEDNTPPEMVKQHRWTFLGRWKEDTPENGGYKNVKYSTLRDNLFSDGSPNFPYPEKEKPVDIKEVIQEIREDNNLEEFKYSDHEEFFQARRKVLKEKYQQYFVVDSGTEKQTLGSGNLILEMTQHPDITMGSTTDLQEPV